MEAHPVPCGKPPDKEDLRVAAMDRFLQTYFPKSTKEKTKLEEEDNYLQTNAQNSVPRYKRGEEIPLSASHSMRM